MKEVKISSEDFHNLIGLMKSEKEIALEMLFDHIEKAKNPDKFKKQLEWIELSIHNYELYDKLQNAFKTSLEIGLKGISIIKEQ